MIWNEKAADNSRLFYFSAGIYYAKHDEINCNIVLVLELYCYSAIIKV